MKILMILGAFDVGGAESHVESLSLALVSLGHEVCVLSRGGESAERLARQGIRQRRLGASSRDPLSVLFDAREVYRAICEESPDIVHAHTRFEAMLASAFCARLSVPLITTAHALFSMTPIKAALSAWGDATVAVSEDIKQHLIERGGLSSEKITVIENGVFCPAHDASGGTAGSKRGHTVLFMSRLDADCSLGADLLCDIAPRLRALYPDASVIISGGGSELERIRARAERVNLTAGAEIIRAVGRVSPSASLFEGVDLFVGVSRAAMEALASGTPTVLLGNEGFLGLLTPDVLGAARSSNLCCRSTRGADASGLLRAICRYFSLCDEERASLSRFSASTARRLYSADEMARKTLALYQKTIYEASRLRVAICGYSGFGNLGDDAILRSILERLTQCEPRPKISVICGKEGAKPCGTRDSTVSRVGFFAPADIIRTLFHSDVFIFGGGSLLQNKTSDRSLLYYLALIGAARVSCKKTVMLANGLGPVRKNFLRRAVLAAINSFDLISVRDGQTQAYLSRALRSRKPILFPDPAILLCAPFGAKSEDADKKCACAPVENSAFVARPAVSGGARAEESGCAPAQDGEKSAPLSQKGAASKESEDLSREDRAEKASNPLSCKGASGKKSGRYFTFSPCADELCRKGISVGEVAELLISLSRRLRARPVIVIMDGRADARPASALARTLRARAASFRIVRPKSPESARDVLSRSLFCLSMRYHASLFSAAAGVPTLQLGDDPKLSALSHSLCLALPVSARAFSSPSLLLRRCDSLLASSPKSYAKRRAAAEKYRRTCELRFRELINYLNSLDFEDQSCYN